MFLLVSAEFGRDISTFTPHTEQNMKVAVLADTHIPKRAKKLPDAAERLLHSADLIIHAGDLISEEFLEQLRDIAPLHAVLGNNDKNLDLPDSLELELEEVKLAIIHDSGNKKGRGKRMRKLFPEAQIVIFGHSHVPMNLDEDGIRLFNPGSPTDKRMQPEATMGLINLNKGEWDAKIIPLS